MGYTTNMNQDVTTLPTTPTKESGSIELWKWKSSLWMMFDLATIGGQRVTLSWDKNTGNIEVRDSNNIVVLATQALQINRYHLSPQGTYTIWVQNTPHYFAIPSRSKGHVSDIIDTAFLGNIGRSLADTKSSIGAFKDFLEESNPNVIGFAGYRNDKDRRNVIIAMIVIVAIAVTAGVVTSFFRGS